MSDYTMKNNKINRQKKMKKKKNGEQRRSTSYNKWERYVYSGWGT